MKKLRYIKSTVNNEIYMNDEVYILAGMYEGEWGIVQDINNGYVYVALWGDPNAILEFRYDELEVRR